MPQPVVPGGPVNARLRQKSMARVTNCDSQLSQSGLCWGAEAFTRPLGELERLARRRPPGAHALLTDIRQKVPRVQSVFTQPVQTLPTSNS